MQAEKSSSNLLLRVIPQGLMLNEMLRNRSTPKVPWRESKRNGKMVRLRTEAVARGAVPSTPYQSTHTSTILPLALAGSIQRILEMF